MEQQAREADLARAELEAQLEEALEQNTIMHVENASLKADLKSARAALSSEKARG